MPIEYLGTSILDGPTAAPSPRFAKNGDRSEFRRDRRQNAYFPGLTVLPSGDLLALFVISESFESADATTWVARSRDLGRTWNLEGALRDLCSRDERSRAGVERPGENGHDIGPPLQRIAPRSDYLKPTALRDGTVIAIGYAFYRLDPEAGISIPETGGILPGEDLVSFSRDGGKTWSPHRHIPRRRPELYEISGPCIELRSGDLLAVAAPFRLPDGRNPSGQVGILLRSGDRGETWSDDEVFFRSPEGNLTPYESRICEMEGGRLVVIVWAYDTVAARNHPNHIVISRDEGRTWSQPINTGIWGQASNLIWIGGDRLLTIHAHRAEEPGIYVRLVDLKGDRWTVLEETVIYGAGSPIQARPGQSQAEMFASLKFGQPSLLRLPDGEILAAHWTEEEGRGRIRLHRLRLR